MRRLNGVAPLLVLAAALLLLTSPAGALAPAALAVALGLAYALVLPAWTATVGKSVPESAVATGWGLISTMEGIGLAIGPALGGSLWRISPGAPILVAAGALCCLGLYYGLSGRMLRGVVR